MRIVGEGRHRRPEYTPSPPWRLVMARLHYVLGVDRDLAVKIAWNHRWMIMNYMITGGSVKEIADTLHFLECDGPG